MTLAPLTSRRYLGRLAIGVVILLLLVLISPGVGSQWSTFSGWDAWRAQLGWTIDAEELSDLPLADSDGDGSISVHEVEAFAEQARAIGFTLRLPRTILALQVGITLALCGAVFQILFRNALATPYTLGLAGGGSLGAMIALRAGWTVTLLGLSSVSLAALIGAIGIVALVFTFARGARRLTSNELLLAGVTLGLFCSAMMMLVTAISSERVTFTAIRWMMGSLDPLAEAQRAALWPLLLPAWIALPLLGRALNQYRLGDELAFSRGVNVDRLQLVCVIVATLAVAGVVARCGPIGFVGLVVPHLAALFVGRDARLLLPASAIAGGIFLILCDWVSQVVMNGMGWLLGRQLLGATLPIGVITSIVGVPLFLLLLRRRLSRAG